MAGCDFTHGTKFLLDDKEYVVRKEDIDNVEVMNLSYQKVETWLKRDLIAAWEQKRLIFRVSDGGLDKLPGSYVDLELIPEPLRKQALYRYSVLEPILDGTVSRYQIPKYASQLTPKVSVATLYRWEKQWKEHKDIRYLVPKTANKGPKGHRTHPEIVSLIEKTLEENSYSGEEMSDEYLYSEFLLKLDEFNEMRDDDDKLPDISNATFRRRKRELLDQRRVNRVLYGSHLAKLMDEGVTQEIVVERPLQRVELDWTPVDVLLLDHGTLKSKRGILVYAVDVFGSMPLGFKLTMNTPTAADIKECLFHCMRPKTYVKETFPRVEHEWVAYGKPRTLVVDNASVNDSLELEDICKHLGIRLQFAKVGAGNQKGTIERAFRTLNQKWIHATVGTTKSNMIQRARYDSEGNACVSPQTFVYMAHVAMIDLVAHAFNRRLGNTPHEKWLEGWRANPHLRNPLPHSFEELQFLLITGHQTRKIQNNGVELLGEHYNSPELMQLKRQMAREGRDNEKVTVRFTTSDMRSVYVYNPFDKTFVEAFALGLVRKGFDPTLPVPDFALEQHLGESNENKRKVDPRARGRAQRTIRDLAKEDKRKKTQAKRRRREGGTDPSLGSGSTDRSNIAVPSLVISDRSWDIPPDSDTIRNIQLDNSNRNARNKPKQPTDEKSVDQGPDAYYSYEISDDDLEDMEVSYK